MATERERLLERLSTVESAAEAEAIDKRLQALDDKGYFGKKVDRLKSDYEKYTTGEINIGEVALRATGEVGETVGNVLGMPFDFYLETLGLGVVPKKIMEVLGTAVMDTEAGQEAVQYLAENPNVLRNMESALNSMELIPATRMASKGLNDLMGQVKTKLKNFYSGDPVGGFAEGLQEGLPNHLRQMVSPQMIADRRVKGTGQQRVNEFLREDIPESDQRGNTMASTFMGMQRENRTEPRTLIDNLPTNQAEMRNVTRLGNTEQMMTNLKSDYPDAVPDAIAQDMLDRTTNAFKGSGGIVDKALGSITNVGMKSAGPKTIVVTRDKGAPGSKLGAEASGSVGVTARALNRLRAPGALNSYAKQVGAKSADDLSPEQIAEFVGSANAFERNNWFKIKDKMPTTTRTSKKTGDKTTSTISQGEAHDIYLRAKAKDPAKRTDKEKQVFSAVEEAGLGKGNVHVGEDGLVRYRSSYASSAKDLGGVGLVLTIDPKTQTMYSMVIDGHDMFGTNPARGQELWNVTPIQVTNYGSKGGKVDIGKKTPEVTAREDAAVKKVEEMTGMMREAGEGIRAFEQRVMRDFKAKPGAQDYAEMAANLVSTGMMATDSDRVTQQ